MPKSMKGKKTRSGRGKRSIFRRKVVKPTRQPTKAFTKLVQAVISRNLENKSRQAFRTSMGCIYPQPGGSYIEYGLVPVSPVDSTGLVVDSAIVIKQGTGQGQRVGNTIRTKYASIKGILRPNLSTADVPVPLEVVMYIFKMKDQSSGNTLFYANDLVANEFYQRNNSYGGVTGELIDIVSAINQDMVHLYHKRVFKLGTSEGSTTGGKPNNDFAFNRKFSINITSYLPKVIKYNDDTGTPSINPLYMLILPYRADGSVRAENSSGCFCDYEINYVYEDA